MWDGDLVCDCLIFEVTWVDARVNNLSFSGLAKIPEDTKVPRYKHFRQ